MKAWIRRGLVAAGIAAATAAVPLAHVAHAGPEGPVVPGSIAVPEGHKVFLVGHAIGVQIYSCTATPTGFAWSLVAPRADLYGDNGMLIATHFGGPAWKARDGSAVVGQVEERAPAEATIPWLRLRAASTTVGADGDRLTGTSYIQRTATTGGLAPAAATCNASTAGDVQEISYTADYHFWRATGG